VVLVSQKIPTSEMDPAALAKMSLRTEDQLTSELDRMPLEETDLAAQDAKNQPDYLPISEITFNNGRVTWSRVVDASSYEVVLAGPFERRLVDDAAVGTEYKPVYTGPETSWHFDEPRGTGRYYVRVRAQSSSGWSPFSVPSSFYFGLAWDANQKSEHISLMDNKHGVTSTARIRKTDDLFGSHHGSVISNVPLTPTSSGKATINLRIDACNLFNLKVGICHSLPPDESSVGGQGFGFSYSSMGYLSHDGVKLRNSSYIYDKDIIRVEVDFRRKNIAFFRNGMIQGKQRFDGVDVSKPLYVCVTLTNILNDDVQVTLL